MTDLSQIVCPNCWSINRVPTLRPTGDPKCGKCKLRLFHANPVELSVANFARFTQRNDISIMIIFWAPGCGYCQMMSTAFSNTATVLEPTIRLANVNIDAEKEIANSL